MTELNVKILLVEDDTSLGYLLTEYLKLKGFVVHWVPNGKKALEKLKSEKYDLAILDVMMPEMDGFELALNFKKDHPELKFIFLTAKSLKVDVLKGFALGGIDYLKKPIDEEELVVRIKAMLARIEKPTYLKDEASKGIYHLGSYLFNSRNQELVRNGTSVHLSSRENELLIFLVQRGNQLCSHKDILLELWGRNDYFNKKSLNVFITHLRKYLQDDASIRIENVHGQGFILRIPSDSL